MKTNKFGEIIQSSDDLCSLLMQDLAVWDLADLTVDDSVDLAGAQEWIVNPGAVATWHGAADESLTVEAYDQANQLRWHMPDKYQQLDIAEYILGLCRTQAELQRVGEELLLYQERNLFNLLRYLKYLVDTMRDNNVIWGVGRGSSVASYVLYLLGVHKIDSMFYDLDPREFLR